MECVDDLGSCESSRNTGAEACIACTVTSIFIMMMHETTCKGATCKQATATSKQRANECRIRCDIRSSGMLDTREQDHVVSTQHGFSATPP